MEGVIAILECETVLVSLKKKKKKTGLYNRTGFKYYKVEPKPVLGYVLDGQASVHEKVIS